MKEETVTHTPGKWATTFISGVCIGISAVVESTPGTKYSQMICNSILPETDEEYESEKGEILANMEFIVRACNAHDEMLDVLKDAQSHLDYLGYGHDSYERECAGNLSERIEAAIAKAQPLTK